MNLEDHRHCRVCGKVTALGNETCSRACREKREAQVRNRQSLYRLMYVAMAIAILGLILSYVGF